MPWENQVRNNNSTHMSKRKGKEGRKVLLSLYTWAPSSFTSMLLDSNWTGYSIGLSNPLVLQLARLVYLTAPSIHTEPLHFLLKELSRAFFEPMKLAGSFHE